MSKVIIFAGTTEGRKLSEYLSDVKCMHTVCVATDYGQQVIMESPYGNIRNGRLDCEEMQALFRQEAAEVVVDATHPYARIVTENIAEACKLCGITYLRLLRNTSFDKQSHHHYFENISDCIAALQCLDGPVFLTTGSKDLHLFTEDISLRERIVARVLPGSESIALCEKAGLKGKSIVAMQGPFSAEMNEALLKEYGAAVLVTKASGSAGGFQEKVQACEHLNIPLYVIGCPEEHTGMDYEEVLLELAPYITERDLHVTLIGCGMGRKEALSQEAMDAMSNAHYILGAERLLRQFAPKERECHAMYKPDEIISFLTGKSGSAVVLFSGDTGFNSGCTQVYRQLKALYDQNTFTGQLRILPGISSVSHLAAHFGMSWDNSEIRSIHGRGTVNEQKAELLNCIRHHQKTYLLLSGVRDINDLGELLVENGNDHIMVYAGYNMAGDGEKYLTLTPAQCTEITEEGLYTLLIVNDCPEEMELMPVIPDDAFIRGKVPMTKEEIRTISISKLHLTNHAVLIDVGSGTGSVAVTAALQHPGISVYAIERNKEACDLILRNKEKFHCSNITVTEGVAPDDFNLSSTPTHAFIGGSGGRMKEIIESLLSMNPAMNIVINAVSLETLNELMQIETEFEVEDFDIVSLSVMRSKKVGNYHMNAAENPVWICSFKGKQHV